MSGATEHLVPGDGASLSPDEFADCAGLSRQELQELQDLQLLQPGSLDLRWAMALREATRLRKDFDLDLFTTGLLAGYIQRIHRLQEQLQDQRAQTRTATAVYTEVSFTAVQVRRP